MAGRVFQGVADSCGDLLDADVGPPCPGQLAGQRQVRVVVGEQRGCAFDAAGGNGSWFEQGDFDAEVARFDGQRLRQRLQCPFAGGVGPRQWDGDPPEDAGDEQQPALAAGTHARQDCLGDAQAAEGVELEQPAHLGQRDARHGGAQRLPGIADQRVHLPGGGDGLVHRFLVGDVEGEPGRGREVLYGGDGAGCGLIMVSTVIP